MAVLSNDVGTSHALLNLTAELQVALDECRGGQTKAGVVRLTKVVAPGVADAVVAEAAAEDASTGRVEQKDADSRAERRHVIVHRTLTLARLERGLQFQALDLFHLALADFNDVIQAIDGKSELVDLMQRCLVARAELYKLSEEWDAALVDLTSLLPKPHGTAAGALALQGDSVAEALESRAFALRFAGQLQEALDEYKKVTTKYKERANAFLQMADLQHQMGDEKACVESMRHASLLRPSDDPLTVKCAEGLVQHAGIDSALDHLGSVIKIVARPVALMQRARLRLQETANQLTREESPEDDKRREALVSGTIQDLNEVIKLEPFHADALLIRGCLEANVGPPSSKTRKRAMEDLIMAGELLPDDPRPNMARGLTFEANGAPYEAIGEYAMAARKTKDGFPLVAAAMVHSQYLEDDMTAIFYASRALDRDPNCVRARIVRADCFYRQGKMERALSDVTSATRHCPDNAIYRAMHARCMLKLGRLKLAAADVWSLGRMYVSHRVSHSVGQQPVPASLLIAPWCSAERKVHTDVSARKGASKTSVNTSSSSGAWGASTEPIDDATAYAIEMVAEIAMMVGKPRDAIAMLEQLDAPSASARSGAGAGAPPLRLSLLAVAWQLAGELVRAATVSAQALACLAKLGSKPTEVCLFWLRRGHLLVALNRPVDAAEAYQTAAQADPSHVAHEALLWARHLAGFDQGGGGGEGGGLGTGCMASRTSDYSIAMAFEELVRDESTAAITHLHYAHVAWRRRELHVAVSQLTTVIELTSSTQPRLHAFALVFRSLVNLHATNSGMALADLCALDDLRKHTNDHQLPQLVQSIAAFARGVCLYSMEQYMKAVAELRFIDVRDMLPTSEADAAEMAVPSEAAFGRALNKNEVAAVRLGLQTRRDVAEAARLQLGVCASFNLGLAQWHVGSPIAALTDFLNAQRCGYMLQTLHMAHADAAPPGPPAPTGLAPWKARWPVIAIPPLPTSLLAQAHMVAGGALHRLARITDATTHYEAALLLQPDTLQALLAIGDLRFEQGDINHARRAYAHAAVRCPQSPLPFVYLARMCQHVGDLEDAATNCERALVLAPNDPSALEAAAVLQLGQGNLIAARDGLVAALAASNAPPAVSERWKQWACTLASVQVALSERSHAVRLYATAADCSMSSPLALSGLGEIAMRGGHWAQAKERYELALAVLSADEARYSLKHIDLTTELLKITPKAVLRDAERRAASVSRPDLGDAMPMDIGASESGADSGNASSVTSGTSAGMSTTRTRTRLQLLRGRLALSAGVSNLILKNLEPAREQLNMAVELRPEDPRALFNRGVFHMVADEWDLAEKDLNACVKEMPLLAEAWMRKSEAVVRQAQFEDKPQSHRMRQVLTDYANALLILDWQEEKATRQRPEAEQVQTKPRKSIGPEKAQGGHDTPQEAFNASVEDYWEAYGRPPTTS